MAKRAIRTVLILALGASGLALGGCDHGYYHGGVSHGYYGYHDDVCHDDGAYSVNRGYRHQRHRYGGHGHGGHGGHGRRHCD